MVSHTSDTVTPTWTLSNQFGCDSVVILNLTINTVDGSAIQINDTTLQANVAGAQYQWLDCDNSYAILSGETNQTFNATVNGNYAVQVTDNGCVDTSACLQVTTIGIVESEIFGLRVSPNPTDGEIDISLGSSYDKVSLIIYDGAGRIVQEEASGNISKTNLLIDKPPGPYTLEIIADTKRAVVRIVKQ